jgi:hypothetical protein
MNAAPRHIHLSEWRRVRALTGQPKMRLNSYSSRTITFIQITVPIVNSLLPMGYVVMHEVGGRARVRRRAAQRNVRRS